MRGGDYLFWLGASAEEAETGSNEPGLATRPGPTGFDPARLWAVINKHGTVIKLDLLLDLCRALNLRLVATRIQR